MRREGQPQSQGSDPLQKLLSIPPAERVAAVSKDVRTKTDEFRNIDPHELAESLGVPTPRWPNRSDWGFTDYAERISLEEYANGSDGLSELVYQIKDKVSLERFQVLVEESVDLVDYCGDPQFGFLTNEERQWLEEELAFEQLESNMENGICTIAQFMIPLATGDLVFEGDIEDDGACITLRTPYDGRDGRFRNLDNCVTDSMLCEKKYGHHFDSE